MRNNIYIPVALIALVLIVGLIYGALERGVIYFEEGSAMPRFSKAAITNPTPSLDRAITYPIDFSDEARAAFDRNVTTLRGELKADPTNTSAWLDLAIYYRMAGDYEGAVEIWKYLRAGSETDGISRHNLGEHYFHYEKDYGVAERYYRESITVMPSLHSNYLDLYEMYRYATKENDKAVAIMEEGIANITQSQALPFYVALGNLYRDTRDVAKARENYTTARDIAREVGNIGVRDAMEQELARLR